MQNPLPKGDLAEIAARLAPKAEGLRGARILLAGGTGFVGRWLTEGLLALDGAEGLGLHLVLMGLGMDAFRVQCPHLAEDPRVTLVEGCLGGDLGLDGVEGITHVVHAASDVNRAMTPAQALKAMRVLDRGTEDLMALVRAWAPRRMLYVSSAAVYDRIPEGAWMSDRAPAPPVPATTGVYAAGKRMGELWTLLHAADAGLEAVVARLGAFTGPNLPLQGGFAVGNFMADALAGRPIVLKGDGSPVRAYQYPVDLVVWLVTLLLEGRPGEAYNVGGDEPVDLRTLADRVQALAGGTGIEVLGAPVPAHLRDVYLPPVDKAREELGLRNEISLEEGLRRMLGWHKGTWA